MEKKNTTPHLSDIFRRVAFQKHDFTEVRDESCTSLLASPHIAKIEFRIIQYIVTAHALFKLTLNQIFILRRD